MKRTLHTLLIILCLVFACARERTYVKIPPPSPRTILLPETETGEPPRPYEVNGKRYYPLPDSHGFVQVGKASWYGKKFHGRPTSNGEIFDMNKKSAAHKTLPMNTLVKVINLSNMKHTVVRINDRGPFVKGRIIDMSYAAAKEMNLIGPGVADVKIVALGREVGEVKSDRESRPLVELIDLDTGEFTIQVGAFRAKDNATRLADRLRVIYDYVSVITYVDEKGETFHRVHVSKSKTLTQAGEIEKKLEDMGFTEAFIVRI
jgi:rare lipoprotein A